jgi:hypothetical protein
MVGKFGFAFVAIAISMGGCVDVDSGSGPSDDVDSVSSYVSKQYNLTVSSMGATVCSPSSTSKIRDYDVTVLGTVYYGKEEGRMMDAGFFLNEARYNFQPYAIKRADADGGLRLAGELLPVGEYRSDHIYEFSTKGTGQQFCFRMVDEYYDDNAGEFTMRIVG